MTELSARLSGLMALSPQTQRLFHETFDAEFYRQQLAEAPPVVGVPKAVDDPKAHFLEQGWRLGLWPCRWFDPMGYLAATPGLAAMGLNPFLHYLEVGLEEGVRAMPFFSDHARRPEGLWRFGRAEYGPVSQVLAFDGPIPTLAGLKGRLVVQLHLFYPEMAAEFCALLAHLPRGFDLLVSVPEAAEVEALDALFRAALPHLQQLLLRPVANRGRDVAPWMVSFRAELLALSDQDLVLHLHSKKSAHSAHHEGWGAYLGHCLLGSPAVAAQALARFAADPTLGVLAPAYWPQVRRAPHYGEVRDLCAHLMRRMRLGPIAPICRDFPAGSFFWARAAVLRPFLQLGLQIEDFPAEAGQICGTPAHAVERLLGAVPEKLGLRFEMVTVDLPFEQAPHQSRPPLRPEAPAPLPADLPGIAVLCAVDLGADDRGEMQRALAGALQQLRSGDALVLALAGAAEAAADLASALLADLTPAEGVELHLLSEVGATRAEAWALAQKTVAQGTVKGAVISYLTPQSLWHPVHLDRLRQAFSPMSETVLYCGAPESTPASRAEALQRSDVRLAAYAHGREVLERGLICDPSLAEGAEWDFILRLTAQAAPDRLAHPSLGFAAPPPRLPAEARRQVQLCHRNTRLYYRQDVPQIALKVPAPRPLFKHRWGDLHLAESLARALEARGARTRVDILPDWYTHHPEDDATLVLRGVTPYEPDPRHINMMWNISHPERAVMAELQRFDHVFVSAYPRGAEVIRHLGLRASVMLQCADPERFHPDVDLRGVPRHEVLFLGNSRRHRRWVPQACIDRGLPLSIYGAEWEGLVPRSYVRATHVPNDRVAAYYRAAKIVLNDHWPNMASEGYVSNRIMDVGLAGGMMISDRFKGEEIFMGQVVTCDTPAEVEAAVRHYLANEVERKSKAEGLHRLVSLHHQVATRADQIMSTLNSLLRDRWQSTRRYG